MMSKFLKSLEAKKKSMPKMDEDEKDAKMSALGALHKMVSEGMMDKLKGAKKVSVMSDSEQGLEKGLDQAKKFVEQKKLPGLEHDEEEEMGEDIAHLAHDGEDEESDEHEESESPEEEASEHEGYSDESPEDADMSPEAIMQQIEVLKAKLKKKM